MFCCPLVQDLKLIEYFCLFQTRFIRSHYKQLYGLKHSLWGKKGKLENKEGINFIILQKKQVHLLIIEFYMR